MTITRSTDAGSTLFLTTIPAQIAIGLAVGAEGALYLYLGMVGASVHTGTFMARKIFSEGYPYMRTESGEFSSARFLLVALLVQANITVSLGVVAGFAGAVFGPTTAAIAAMVVPAIDTMLGEHAWYLSPSMIVVQLGGRLLGEESVLPEEFRGALLTESDLFHLLGRPRSR